MAKAAPRSLKTRAIVWLSQREHSRSELAAKLKRVAGEDEQTTIEPLLDWLTAHSYLSEQRFVESRVHARAAKFGNRRIQQELAQHRVALDAQASAQLRASELDRARAVWQRKFKELAGDAAGRAKQMRFLAARGFGSDVIRRVVKGLDDE
jgi:regulatory protein